MTSFHATFFGKIPSHGDFVRGYGQHQLIGHLDQWLSQTMEKLSESPHWKCTYDNATAFDFAFVGASSQVSLIGHLSPSHDASGRRFPFLTVAVIERADTLMFRCAPTGLQASYAALGKLAEEAINGVEPKIIQHALERLDCAQSFDLAIRDDPLGTFVRQTTLQRLTVLLGWKSPEAVQRIILAIGLLMRPVLIQREVSINKNLVIPLPPDEPKHWIIAGLWQYLITGFLHGSTVELQIILDRRQHSPRMLIGFNGPAAHTLCTALSSEASNDVSISLFEPTWIEGHQALRRDHGIAKLMTYMAQPNITLERIVNTFQEIFLKE